MSDFDNVDLTTIEETDSVGFSYAPSNLYPAKISMAFLDASKNTGTKYARIECKVLTEKGKEPRTITRDLYYSHKGGAIKDKAGNTSRGFAELNGLCLLATDTTIVEVNKSAQSRVVKVGKDTQEERQVLMDLVGKQVYVGLLHEKTNKNMQDPVTGMWVPTAVIREDNRIDKFFHAEDKTVSSEHAKGLDATFVEKWKSQYVTGEVLDKTKPVNPADQPKQGSPSGVSGKPSDGVADFD